MTDLLQNLLKDVHTVGISGHIHPDGDCVGSVLGLSLYLKQNFPMLKVHPYLESIGKSYQLLNGLECIDTGYHFPKEPFDLFISLDCGSLDRLGNAVEAFQSAKKKVAFDHHITNTHFADENYVDGSASSTCEVLFGYMEPERIELPVAEALYLGIVHDTGVFKYSCTSEKTMNIAGFLMSKGINTAELIDRSFYLMTFLQLKTSGYALNKAELSLGGKMSSTVLTLQDLERLGATAADTESIVNSLRTVEGVEAAVFIREDAPSTYKFSLRSNGKVDVSAISAAFNGGGHKLAAGFTATGNLDEIFTQVSAMIMLQL